MEVCGLTRILLPAAVVGIIMSTVTLNETVGWVAAIITGAVVWAAMRAAGDRGACATPGSDDIDVDVPEPVFTVEELLER